MFSRRFTAASKDSIINSLNLNSSELLEAISNDENEKILALIKDPNLKIWEVKDENGYTALHRSVFKNNYELSSMIIEEVKKGLGLGSSHKIDDYVNEKTNEGFTALHYAVNNGNIKMVKLLKEFGAKVESLTVLGKNVVHLASEANQPTMLIYLVLNEPLDIFSVDENGSTPLHWACYSGAEESVKYLINLKSDINALDKEKYTPLHLAVINNRENIVRLLLQNGADKNIANDNQELPIDTARKKNYLNLVELLRDKEFNPLCTLESPVTYIPPTNIYKKLILLMIIIPEIIIFILVLPFLEEMYHTYVNFITFFLCLLSFIILIFKNPGYQKNMELIKQCGGEANNKPLKKLVDDNFDLKNYCPICFVENINNNIKHCFLCNKCVSELNHHCVWFNKCIGKNNKISYLAFIFFTFCYAFYSIFICAYLLFDSVYIPYEKVFPPVWFNFGIDRGFRVLGAGLVIVFSIIISFPLFFLFMIDIFKSCGLIKKKKRVEVIRDISYSEVKRDVELDKKIEEPLIEHKDEDNNNININLNIDNNNLNENNQKDNINNDEKDNKFNIPIDNFPLVDNRISTESMK